MATEKRHKFPRSLAACADLYYELRQRRLEGAKALQELEAEERALKQHLIDNLPKAEASGVAGKTARVALVAKQVPQAEDWEALYAYVKRTGSFDLLQRRLSESAVQERWEAGKDVPGVRAFSVLTLSVHKL